MENLKFTKIRFFVLLILILVGIGLCIDLSYIFYKTNFLPDAAPSFCSVSDFIDCDGVSKTTYALTFGIPNSLWGMALYLIMLFLLFVDRLQNKFKNTIFDLFQNPRAYIATLGFIFFCVSMIFASISIQVIHKICVLCFATYIINLLIALVASPLFDDFEVTLVDFFKGVKKYFVLFLAVVIVTVGALWYFNSSLIFSPKLRKERQNKEFYEAKKNKYSIKGNVLGKADAKVTVKLFTDFNCPYCRIANIMLHKAARERNILVEGVNFPLNTKCNSHIGGTLGGHEPACMLAKYALAAKKQGKFWGATSAIFDNRPTTVDEVIEEFERAHLGLDNNQLKSDANSPLIEQELKDEIDGASAVGVGGTPCIEINGIQFMGLMPYDVLIERIDQAQKRADIDAGLIKPEDVQSEQQPKKESLFVKFFKIFKKK